MRDSIWHVGLLISSSSAYGRGLLRGVGQYVAAHGPWEVFHRPGTLPTSLPATFRRQPPDGLLIQLENPTLVRQVRRRGLPTVDFYGRHRLPRVPRIETDDAAIGRMAADFFLGLGYRQFAYCGCLGIHYCENRCRSYVEYLGGKGFEAAVFQNPPARDAVNVFDREAASLWDTSSLGRWLRRQETPLAVMAGSDLLALQVLAACRQARLAVPSWTAPLWHQQLP